jgi:hypothetical protein
MPDDEKPRYPCCAFCDRIDHTGDDHQYPCTDPRCGPSARATQSPEEPRT